MVARRARAGATLSPDAGQHALLADPGFVLEPDLQRLAPRRLGQDIGYEAGEPGLKDACAAASCPGWRGRTDSRRKPSSRNRPPTVRSASVTPNRAATTRARSIRRQRTTPCSAVAFQSHGQRDGRDSAKLVWTLPIAEYSDADIVHREIAAAGERAATIAAAVDLSPHTHFSARRRAVRAAPVADGIAAEIEVLVAALLPI